MGKRGPKPKPSALRVFEGDPGRKLPGREGEIAPASAATAPVAPEWLGDHGKAVWMELAPQLHAIGCLTDVDCRLLSLYCDAWDDFHAALAEIAAGGIVATSDKGGEYQHPAVGIKNKARLTIKQLGGEFGLSPASRVGLKLQPADGGDALEAFKTG